MDHSAPDVAGVFRSHGHDGTSPVRNAGLYLHIPFCSAICPYCDFAVAQAREPDRHRFVEALVAEIGAWRAPGTGFDTVYFGGGTPSILDPVELDEIRLRLEQTFDLASDCHWSLEANPEDVDERSLDAWLRLGFRGLSLGLQSIKDRDLRFLGRRHRGSDSRRSLDLALRAGFEVVSADLIYGLVNQSDEDWSNQLTEIVDLGPHHLSCYELTVHRGTPFYRQKQSGQLPLPDQDRRAALFALTHRKLESLGFDGYEVSSFARRPSLRSRHNQKYWRHVPYLGLGPSAHSFDGRSRWWNMRPWRRYVELVESGADPGLDRESLGLEELAMETILLAMRTRDGLNLPSFESRFGIDLMARNRTEIAVLTQRGWLEAAGDALLPTLEGLAVADELARRLS